MCLGSQKTPGQSLSELEMLSYRNIRRESPWSTHRKKMISKVGTHLLKINESGIISANIAKILIKNLIPTIFNIKAKTTTTTHQISVGGFFSQFCRKIIFAGLNILNFNYKFYFHNTTFTNLLIYTICSIYTLY